jgi:uncharacterized protein (DUF1015 family)
VTGVVRPSRALIVRQEYAAEHVSQMLDARPAAQRRADAADPVPLRPVDPAAYDEWGPALYVYRLRRDRDEHIGVVGEVSAEAFIDGRVRGHEAVQPERVAGLVDHFTSEAVRSELVALLHPFGPAVDVVVAACLAETPLIQFTGPDAWEQTVWRVPDAAGQVLADALSEGVHYIADGHHRVAASLTVWQRDGRPTDAGLMCVMFPFDGLRLLAFHRRVSGPVAPEELLALLAHDFDLSGITRPDEATGSFALYVEGRWYDAVHRGPRAAGAAGLDISVLNTRALEPLLGAGGVPDARVEISSALSSLEELTKACDEDGGALFALRPPSVEQITEVADRGEVMPPKTTYFDPKPYAGIFLR